jgi:hypothetical protein
MSEERDDDLESAIRFFEKNVLRRKLTAQERAEFEEAHRASAPQRESLRLAYNPMARARATLNHMRKLKSRQGSIMPDFDELYRRKYEIDRKLLGDD